MVFSNRAIVSLLAGCLFFCLVLEPCASRSNRALLTGETPPFTGTKLEENGRLCGVYGVHAGTGIVMGLNTRLNLIVEGKVGVSAPDFELASDIMDRKVDSQPIAPELAGVVFTAGDYRSSSFNVVANGIVTLDGDNAADSMFFFYSDASMFTGAGSEINLINGALAKNVFWVLGSSLNTGAGSNIGGSILAGESITFGASTTVLGGCIAAISGTITFGAQNDVTVVPVDTSSNLAEK
jgi:hypothetical protein